MGVNSNATSERANAIDALSAVRLVLALHCDDRCPPLTADEASNLLGTLDSAINSIKRILEA
jgi:hypothetical protein